MPLVFVYGTLMRGDVRAASLADQQFVGEAVTTPRYRLLNCGDYPGLIEVPADGEAIEGEVYDVSPECLQRLDRIEAVDEGLYERRPIILNEPFAGRAVEAYFYLLSTEGLPDCGPRWSGRRVTR